MKKIIFHHIQKTGGNSVKECFSNPKRLEILKENYSISQYDFYRKI